MILLPIYEKPEENQHYSQNPYCRDILDVYPAFYGRVGFTPPWIGYFAELNGILVGCGGFKGSPKNGLIEIAYGTFEEFQQKGIGTEICRLLTQLSLETDPKIVVSARTLPENNFSTRILEKNGFVSTDHVWDEEDGYVMEWFYKGS